MIPYSACTFFATMTRSLNDVTILGGERRTGSIGVTFTTGQGHCRSQGHKNDQPKNTIILHFLDLLFFNFYSIALNDCNSTEM